MVFRLFTLHISLLAATPAQSLREFRPRTLSYLNSLFSTILCPLVVLLDDQLDFIVYAGGLLKVKCFNCLLLRSLLGPSWNSLS